MRLPVDSRELLKLFNVNRVRYLLIGGYAVTYHGYPRSTAVTDFWVAQNLRNAERVIAAIDAFGFGGTGLITDLFMVEAGMIRFGRAPNRIELLTQLSGVDFDECYENRLTRTIDRIKVDIISLPDLRKNKQASGRHKDLADLENLPIG